MTRADFAPTTRVERSPLRELFFSFPGACFIGALMTDVVYWRTAEMTWSDFSAWLITVGVITGYLAALVRVISYLRHRQFRPRRSSWLTAIGTLAVLVLATINMMVHTRDAWTSVVPFGLALSAATVFVLLVTGWIGGAAVYPEDEVEAH